MGFLSINGLPITIAFGGQAMSNKIGGAGRSIGGTYLDAVRAVKRQWRFKTTPLAQTDAETLMGLLNGQGQHWPMNSNAVADSGLTPTAGDTGAVYHGANAADGDPQKLVYTAPATTANLYALGSGAIWCAGATTNLLTKNPSDADEDGAGTSGWVKVGAGASVATDATHYWQGARSIKLTTGNANEYALSDESTSVTSGDVVYASAWLKGVAGSESVKIHIDWRDSGDVSDSTTSETFTLAMNEWRRVWVKGTAPAPTDDIRIRIEILDASGALYLDGVMAAKTDGLTPWVVGGTPSALVAPDYGSPLPTGTTACTIAAWSNYSAATAQGSTTAFLWEARVDANNLIRGYADGATGNITAQYTVDSDATYAGANSAAETYGLWSHIAMTYNNDSTTMRCYVNGSQIASSTLSDGTFDFDDIATFHVGASNGNNNPLNGALDQLVVLPYELSADQIEDLYNTGTPQAFGLPKLVCTGDFVSAAAVNCIGKISSVRYRPVTIGGTWANNAVEIDFTLFEV